MPISFLPFEPCYTITPKIANALIRIEAAKQKVIHLPLTPKVLISLRETARLYTTHYSTMIEGNRLKPDEISKVLENKKHFPGREREEAEVKGYYTALRQVEQWTAKNKKPITEQMIQKLHALVISNGRLNVRPSPYREGQNVIRDNRTKSIIYLPPEAKDVPKLMNGMVKWIENNENVPCPLIAGIAHYQFATIHPYYDGNGRTARLLTTLILHLGGYDLKGLYSLEEYYGKDLMGYYNSINIGQSHNYYLGRSEADITPWIEYFIEGAAISFESVLKRMEKTLNPGQTDQTDILKKMDPKQRKVLELFNVNKIITAQQIGMLLSFKPRTSSQLCKRWLEEGFLEAINLSKKKRSYCLGKSYRDKLALL